MFGLPTKSNNTGGRGGARAGAGRKKKSLADKVAAGNPGGRPLVVLDIPDMPEAVDLEGTDMPEPREFLTSQQRDGY